jgi:hypothetical protein
MNHIVAGKNMVLLLRKDIASLTIYQFLLLQYISLLYI